MLARTPYQKLCRSERYISALNLYMYMWNGSKKSPNLYEILIYDYKSIQLIFFFLLPLSLAACRGWCLTIFLYPLTNLSYANFFSSFPNRRGFDLFSIFRYSFCLFLRAHNQITKGSDRVTEEDRYMNKSMVLQ
jgi:hypothetical protein